jgi:hypothetical protein
MRRYSRKLRIVAVTVALLVIIAAIVLPAFNRARTTCVNNLRQMDGAKHGWALENKKSKNIVVTWDDIRPYIKLDEQNKIPGCPKGGTYTLGHVGEPPTCSYPGHKLQ